jgi:hypothetical protein
MHVQLLLVHVSLRLSNYLRERSRLLLVCGQALRCVTLLRIICILKHACKGHVQLRDGELIDCLGNHHYLRLIGQLLLSRFELLLSNLRSISRASQ